MKRFLSFCVTLENEKQSLAEAKTLTASGKDAQRHTEKYINPNLISGKTPTSLNLSSSPLSLNKDTQVGRNVVPAGSKLMPIHGTHQIINGVHHHDFHAISPEGKIGKIPALPHSKITTETDKTGKHNDERAVIKTWNYFAKKNKGRHPEVHEMHNELKDAKENPSHPLHISNADPAEFTHGINGYNGGSPEVKKRAEATYYGNLHNSAYVVSAMAKHKDFKKSWKDRDIMESSGRLRPQMSKLYVDKGVTGAGATAKADNIVVRPRVSKLKNRKKDYKAVAMISLKDEKGSQLMSSSPAEFHAIYEHSFNKLRDEGSISGDQHKKALSSLVRARGHLDAGAHEKANDIIKNLHLIHNKNGLLSAVHREAITGEGKFKTKEGTATHVATIGPEAEVHHITDFMKKYAPWFHNPRAGSGKHGEQSTAVRLDTPSIPKQRNGQIQRLAKHKAEGSGPYALSPEERDDHIAKVHGGFFLKAKTNISKAVNKVKNVLKSKIGSNISAPPITAE